MDNIALRNVIMSNAVIIRGIKPVRDYLRVVTIPLQSTVVERALPCLLQHGLNFAFVRIECVDFSESQFSLISECIKQSRPALGGRVFMSISTAAMRNLCDFCLSSFITPYISAT